MWTNELRTIGVPGFAGDRSRAVIAVCAHTRPGRRGARMGSSRLAQEAAGPRALYNRRVRDRPAPGGAGSAASASVTSAREPGKQSLTEKLGRPAPPPAQVGQRALTDAYAGAGGDPGGPGAAGDQGGGSGSSGAPVSPGGPPPAVQEALASETGAPLSDAVRWSKRLRADLSGARIVTGPRAEAATAALGTAAFTVGNRVFLGVGVTPSDETVLAHELTHVVQQMGATVPSPDQLKMTSPDDQVEREARGEGGDHAPGAHGDRKSGVEGEG